MSITKRIYDLFGRAVAEPPAETLSRRSIVDAVSDRASALDILLDLTPTSIASAFTAADNGFPAQQVEIALTVEERDPHVRACIAKRASKAVAVEWKVEPADESEAARKAGDAFREVLEALDADAIKGHLMSALLPQWAVLRVIWETGSQWRPTWVEPVDPRRLVWPFAQASGADASLDTIAPQVSLDMTTTNVEPLSAGRYITHQYEAVRGRPGRMALVRSIAWLWLFKRMSMVSLAKFCERFGLPHVAVKYDPARLTTEQARSAIEEVAAAAAGGAFGLPIGSEMEVVQAAASGTLPHEVMCRLCDEAISKAIVGATTLTDAANTGTSQSVSSPVHGDSLITLRNADCKAMCETVRRDLAAPFCVWNFGPNTPIPKIVPVLEAKPEPESRGRVFIQAQQLGLAVKADEVYSQLGIERPEGVPDVLMAQVAQIQRMGTGTDGLTAPSGRGGAATSEPVPGAQAGPAGAAQAGAAGAADQTSAAAVREFNGAQVQSATTILTQVATGEVAPDAAVLMLVEFFGISEDRARAMVEAQAQRREERREEAAEISAATTDDGAGSRQQAAPAGAPPDGDNQVANATPRPVSAASQTVPAEWVDAAAGASSAIQAAKFERARAVIEEMIRSGVGVEDLRSPEVMAAILDAIARTGAEDAVELARQAMLAAGLRGTTQA